MKLNADTNRVIERLLQRIALLEKENAFLHAILEEKEEEKNAE